MRYILNSSGYICNISFGADIYCDSGNCTGYTGEVPADYSTLEEWHDGEIDKLNAWKIVDGNLVFDPNKYEELQAILKEEEENNRHITNKEFKKAMELIEPVDEIEVSNTEDVEVYVPTRTLTGNIISIEDAGAFKIPHIKITSDSDISNEIKLICTNKNLLPNEARTTTKGDAMFSVNGDLSINVTGTLESADTLTLAGSTSNVEPLFILKENTDYILSSLPEGFYCNLYNNDGTEIELVHSSNGGTILLSNSTGITHVELAWNDFNEATEMDSIIYPALYLGETELEYEMHRENKAVISLGKNTLTSEDNIVIENERCLLNNKKELTIDNFLKTYEGNNIIYTFQNTNLEITYIKANEYESISATNILHISDTYVSDEAINKLEIKNVNAGSVKNLISGATKTEVTNSYPIDLSDLTGTVDIYIDTGTIGVFQNEETVKILDGININTYDGNTYIYIQNETGASYECEYMSSSTFIELHPITIEKTGAVRVYEDGVSIEVTRTSENDSKSANIELTVTDKQSDIYVTADEVNLNGEVYVNGIQIEELVEELGDSRYYTQREIDKTLKVLEEGIKENYYDKSEIDEKFAGIGEGSTEEYYTKTEIDEVISNLEESVATSIEEGLEGLEGKEDAINKVNVLDESSTDEQYPTAKCVYDLIGNVEAVLAELTEGVGV